MVVLRDMALEVALLSALNMQGINPAGRRISPFLQRLNEEAIDEARKCVAPVLGYDVFPIAGRDAQGITIGAGARLEGAYFVERLAQASEVVVAACTVGAGVEERIAAHYVEDAARAMALGGAASAAVIEMCTRTCRMVTDESLARGLQAGMTMVPGELGCPLQAQRPIFTLLDGATLGIRLSPSNTLSPTYSLNFIIPLGPAFSYGEGGRCPACRYYELCPVRDEPRVS